MSIMSKLTTEIRCCTYVYTLEYVICNKDAFITMFTCIEFHDCESTQSKEVKDKINVLKTTLSKRVWWGGVMDVYHVIMQIM